VHSSALEFNPIATLMTQTPCIWLLDEPTNRLDLHHQVKVMAVLKEQAVANKTVFMCLDDLNLAARWCSHVLLLCSNDDDLTRAGRVAGWLRRIARGRG